MTVLIKNKKAYFNYELLDKFEAGAVLCGFEVKSLKKGQGSFEGSHLTVCNEEVFLIGVNIPPYQPANTPKNYDPMRIRKLLLNKKEIKKLADAEKQKGLTIVPISCYTKNNKIKFEIAIVRGKKKYDKREVLKKRDSQRDIAREIKRF